MKIINIKKLPELGVSHNPEIKKKVLIGDQEIPGLMFFGEAVIKPGQSVEKHSHETMYEVFYISFGKAIFNVGGNEVEASVGDCITIEPKEEHSQNNPFNEDVRWLYFGISVD